MSIPWKAVSCWALKRLCMSGTVVQHLFGCLQVTVLFSASALPLDYTLEQFPGEGCLGELQGKKEEHRNSQEWGSWH